ncbi:unnamed protein product [Rhodiola kirilowii]
MTDNKQAVPLNDTFYGPSIPPTTYHRRRHTKGRSCLCSLFCFLFKIILALVILVGLAILIFWLIFRPTPLNFQVTEAALTEFAIANITLKYNLAVSLTARNPNSRVGVHYDRMEANAYYDDQRFSSVTLNDFDQGHKNTSVFKLVFKGQKVVVFGESESSEFDEEKLTGVYPIDLRVYLRLKLRFGKLTTKTMKSKIACDLEVPLNNGNGFQTTKCHLKM